MLKTEISARYRKLMRMLGASCMLVAIVGSGCASPGPTPTNPEFLRVTCLYQGDHESCSEYKSLIGTSAKPEPSDHPDSEPQSTNPPGLLERAGDGLLIGGFIFVEFLCMGCIR
jgi:hypothetical protein